jgi:hypothetical protein
VSLKLNNELIVKKQFSEFFIKAYGSVVVEHCLSIAGFPDKCQIGKNFNVETGWPIEQ